MTIKHFHIGGMTCVNCQNRIEKKLKTLNGISKISVSYRTGIAKIEFDTNILSFKRIEKVIKNLGYEVLNKREVGKANVIRAVCLLLVIIALYIVLQQFGVLNLLVPSQLADSSMGYGMLFVVGLLTSVHCIAMCGGINLSQCLPGSVSRDGEKKNETYLPSIFYNLGRVISYTAIGFLFGLIGWLIGGDSGLGIPMILQGILKLIAGVLMVIMGINMLGIFPWLHRLNIRLPGFISKRIDDKKATATQPFIVGLLNGLMPCGPLQSIQILALASANPFIGALSMFLFSLGTVPLMLGLGSVVTALGKRFTYAVMNIGAVFVTVLGFAMIAQGGSLSGLLSSEILLFLIIGFSIIGIVSLIPFSKKTYRAICVITAIALIISVGVIWQGADRDKLSSDPGTQVVDGVQSINSVLLPGQYPSITVQAGVPVIWSIDAPKGSINGCNYKMFIQEYGIEHVFQIGENIIEFTPTETGKISYTCWMGMIRGTINVVDNSN